MVWCILNGVVREVISNKSSEQKLNDTRGHLMYIGMYYIYIYIFFFLVLKQLCKDPGLVQARVGRPVKL